MNVKTATSVKQLVLVILSFTVLLSACKKDKKVKTDEPREKGLFTSWIIDPQVPGSEQTLYFDRDSTFYMRTFTYSTDLVISSHEVLSGKFRTKGDSLKFMVTQRKSKIGNAEEVTTPANDKIYDHAVFQIKDNKLILKYDSYPADAPVATTATYREYLIAL
ncbi:hypothetical protein [Mucilaginibacter pedocola]|uniref:Lipocalin-like domain-containing protein n=1 Tax=Mucilaginibacter pedocola TaxID=1792845 RepID=A0A1S9PL96_9SPHI|nr:hypothetical protein [Mucilaginibacter pedocola]OOQ61711.1 hypothetical protein BC343_01155 [Mucilaginibacter pedocola]